jgi:hypothetical protein
MELKLRLSSAQIFWDWRAKTIINYFLLGILMHPAIAQLIPLVIFLIPAFGLNVCCTSMAAQKRR